MADDSRTGQSAINKTNGNAGLLKPRAGGTSPKLTSRSSSVDKSKRRSYSFKANGNGDSSLVSTSLSADPLKLELNRLENALKVKGLELEKVVAEGKALKQTNIGKDKAIKLLRDELDSLREKDLITQKQLESKVLELKKANDEKKTALSSQAAAEATMRRLQASQKDNTSPSIELALAPVEAQLKVALKEVTKLQENCKAQERLIRTKEAALIEADKAVAVAEEKAKQVEEIQNKNHNLAKQVEAAQEENKTLDKLYKQKVEEVKKLTAQVSSLEEALTAAGAAANTIKDYQRQVQDLQAELKITQEELARAKVAVNRVAVVVANEWKDEKDKVIPMKQWLEERKAMQGEAQSLRDKLALAERAAKFEAQMKEKYLSRLKVIEEGLKFNGMRESNKRYISGSVLHRLATPGTSPRTSTDLEDVLNQSGIDDFNGNVNGRGVEHGSSDSDQHSQECRSDDGLQSGAEDVVPGVLHDLLQKEVVSLRRTGLEKDQGLKDRDDAIEMLSKKVELLTRAMETEAKKSRREIWSMEKEMTAIKLEMTSDSKKRQTPTRLSSQSPFTNKKTTS